MRVVVTGHEGFVGTHLTKALKDAGHEVIGFDKKGTADLSDTGWAGYIPVCDLIVHLASTCSTQGSIDRPMETFGDAVVSTAVACEWARHEKVPLLLTSSVKARDGSTPYGAAKYMAETWAYECGRTFGFPVIVNRPGTIYGPGQEGSPESGWIAWFTKARDEGFPITINGDGSQTRDLLHVYDYVSLLMSQIEDPEGWEWAYPWDVGGGKDNAVSVLDMAKHLGLEYTFGPSRYGDAMWYVGYNDTDKWAPVISWKDVL